MDFRLREKFPKLGCQLLRHLIIVGMRYINIRFFSRHITKPSFQIAGDRRDHHGTRLFHRPRLRKCVQLLALYRQNRL